MLQGRVDEQTATLLHDGTVLVVGVAPISAELYDPDSGSWIATAATIEERGYHTATLLEDGTVLVAGGNVTGLASAELYDPEGGSWSATGAMETGRAGHTATLLEDGKVLVTGGQSGTGEALASAEVYDPATGAWTSAGSMAESRVELHRDAAERRQGARGWVAAPPATASRRGVRPRHRHMDNHRKPHRAAGITRPRCCPTAGCSWRAATTKEVEQRPRLCRGV